MSLLAILNPNDSHFQGYEALIHDVYNHFIGIILIVAVLSTLGLLFFLMWTHDDKKVSGFKQVLKNVWITVTIILIIGTVYITMMHFAINGSWDQDNNIDAHEVQSAASMFSSSSK